MRKKEFKSSNRVHVSYPDSLKDNLSEIRETTGRNSLSEVFREALKFYTLAYQEHKKGSDFLIRNKNGEIERLRMFM
jgi:metal-responsive CopG/Arc/MetJ family transcriptional regulator